LSQRLDHVLDLLPRNVVELNRAHYAVDCVAQRLIMSSLARGCFSGLSPPVFERFQAIDHARDQPAELLELPDPEVGSAPNGGLGTLVEPRGCLENALPTRLDALRQVADFCGQIPKVRTAASEPGRFNPR